MSATNGTDTTKGLIGKSVKRVEDKRFTTGNGKYTDDIVLPNQTYASFVRSPYAHAKILSVDITASSRQRQRRANAEATVLKLEIDRPD
jgi:CO/xanthine dehydrogenase Mo-binding subunit